MQNYTLFLPYHRNSVVADLLMRMYIMKRINISGKINFHYLKLTQFWLNDDDDDWLAYQALHAGVLY